MISIADGYFTGLEKNDGKDNYPFTNDCHRQERRATTNVPCPANQPADATACTLAALTGESEPRR